MPIQMRIHLATWIANCLLLLQILRETSFGVSMKTQFFYVLGFLFHDSIESSCFMERFPISAYTVYTSRLALHLFIMSVMIKRNSRDGTLFGYLLVAYTAILLVKFEGYKDLISKCISLLAPIPQIIMTYRSGHITLTMTLYTMIMTVISTINFYLMLSDYKRASTWESVQILLRNREGCDIYIILSMTDSLIHLIWMLTCVKAWLCKFRKIDGVEAAARNFFKLDFATVSRFSCDELIGILTSQELRIMSDDSLFDMIILLIRKNQSYRVLLNHVPLTSVGSRRKAELLTVVDPNTITDDGWNNIRKLFTN